MVTFVLSHTAPIVFHEMTSIWNSKNSSMSIYFHSQVQKNESVSGIPIHSVWQRGRNTHRKEISSRASRPLYWVMPWAYRPPLHGSHLPWNREKGSDPDGCRNVVGWRDVIADNGSQGHALSIVPVEVARRIRGGLALLFRVGLVEEKGCRCSLRWTN
jgi:hypothetical protein